MNATPTPETDAAAYEATTRTVGKWIVPLAKARNMERKRDEWQQKALQYKAQRDEARATCSELVTDSDAITLARTVVRVTKERDEAREYADKLVDHKDMVCLPKDLEVLREANLGLAVELNEAQNEILGWKNKWDCAIDMAARAENALDEMTLRWERTNDALFNERAERKRVDEYATDLCCTLRCELDDERALADRLAKGIELFLSQTVSPLAPLKVPLDAWKEARKS